jgi:N-sulfoglucosamine sulfohydrolase
VIEVDSHHAGDVAPITAETLATVSQPFFMSVGFFETHRSFRAPTSVRDTLYSLPPYNLPDTPRTREDIAAFKASARSLDQGIGAVLNALHTLGLVENTVIICTTDHGLPFPAAKATLYDRGLGVMLLMRGPGGFIGGKVFDSMVTHLDIFPTICDLADAEHPSWLQGKSLLPLVRGDVDRLHEEIFAEMTFHAAYQPLRAIRTERWKYIRYFGDYPYPPLANIDDGATKEMFIENGWGRQPIREEQLYDLLFDPNEAANLAESTAHFETMIELRARLERWMDETDDPLRFGPIDPPPGAFVNAPTDRSAVDPTMAVADVVAMTSSG